MVHANGYLFSAYILGPRLRRRSSDPPDRESPRSRRRSLHYAIPIRKHSFFGSPSHTFNPEGLRF